ncbi:fructose-specific PTS transporter subunit EIIC (plasmid) [Entomospira nematocerorum]|uniref:PTS transporter subunit EIIC n=1 Tax=Entomospira nematocerorum TaxID=2719987 RepID=A0A968GDS2_9SPIO|nr:fructose-specific PTS transporter subunit EIIC [Entomospira nematocera]NIZ47633.1 PTS transporter subunit EIIC [Entomospira nematocera]WDI34637.1 fructose-specific PTS transporter subunit EIIC [Entomospira nematocera]
MSQPKYIIAATGCPTGVAHTFMAAEALRKAAKELDVEIKVETHGQVGIENPLTKQDIEQADCVIIAADKDVQAHRFGGKPVIVTSVGDGIKRAKALVEQAITDTSIPIMPMQASESASADSSASMARESLGRRAYKHLMSGVSHMLPFVVGGGVLIALSFFWGIHSADPSHEQYNPIAAKLMTIGGVSMGFMVPVLAAFIAQSIASRPGLVVGFIGGSLALQGGTGFLGGLVAGFLSGGIILLLQHLFKPLPKSLQALKAIFLYPVLGIISIGLIMLAISAPMEQINHNVMQFLAQFEDGNPLLLGLIVGSMMAFDMGGPINKAAYVTGTVLLAQGNTSFMAGVMAAGMTPPLITALATTLFSKQFDAEERNAGVINYLLSATFITEGAIPFASKDPLKVIPIFMIGSSLSAMLTYLFKVAVPAPHGGLIVLPLVTHGLLWLIAIILGSLLGALLMGLQRRYWK